MRKLTLDEIKSSELETLIILDNYCKKYNLKYYLACGTLLGAVRYKNFIPWDDDIDVFMPRKDYEYLINNFNKDFHNYREVISKKQDFVFYFSHAKIIDNHTTVVEKYQSIEIGVWIDVFPLDSVVNNKFQLVKNGLPIEIINFILKYVFLKIIKERILYKNIIIWLIKIIFPSEEFLLKRREKYINEIIDEKSDTYGLIENFNGIYMIPSTAKSTFDPAIKLEFAGNKFNAPNNYDKILSFLYGKNYMKPSKKYKRLSSHDCVYYYLDKPRRSYANKRKNKK